MKVVFDTNVLISGLLGSPQSPPHYILLLMLDGFATPLLSEETFQELCEVLSRDRLKKYIPARKLITFPQELALLADWVEPVESILICRDSKDNKFLEVAVSGGADYLVSGDNDLLVLNPFKGIPIITFRRFNALPFLERRFSIHSLGLKTRFLSPLKTNVPLSQHRSYRVFGKRPYIWRRSHCI
ncbi:MAG: putative toxin-antitoxin system toxin component, PIN family [Scytonema sp. PMC 1069.18]|nr:putative toxin-antitoxin system toxin component, PIN family [Scytonema sp. PMC 1069.18]MEC4883239.1 putative toxin-antitoxin system toxin component, PIN family [Scytonema sp. PMC 1070.18]